MLTDYYWGTHPCAVGVLGVAISIALELALELHGRGEEETAGRGDTAKCDWVGKTPGQAFSQRRSRFSWQPDFSFHPKCFKGNCFRIIFQVRSPASVEGNRYDCHFYVFLKPLISQKLKISFLFHRWLSFAISAPVRNSSKQAIQDYPLRYVFREADIKGLRFQRLWKFINKYLFLGRVRGDCSFLSKKN